MTTTRPPTDAGAPRSSPAQAFGQVLDAAVSSVATKLERTTSRWIDKLNAVTESGGVTQRAGVEGVKAHLRGKSPVRAAVRSVWQNGTPAVRAAVVTAGVAAVLLLLLSPVLLLIYLLSLLVVAAVSRTRQARGPRPATA